MRCRRIHTEAGCTAWPMPASCRCAFTSLSIWSCHGWACSPSRTPISCCSICKPACAEPGMPGLMISHAYGGLDMSEASHESPTLCHRQSTMRFSPSALGYIFSSRRSTRAPLLHFDKLPCSRAGISLRIANVAIQGQSQFLLFNKTHLITTR